MTHLFHSRALPTLMRRTLTLAAAILLCGQARAADYPVKINAVRVGLPPAGKSGDDAAQSEYTAKVACWAPVYVDLELTTPVQDAAELVIEAPDSDEITTTLTLPLNLAGAGGKVSLADLGVIGYVRPTAQGELTATIRTKDGGKALSEPFRARNLRPRDPITYMVLSLGGTLQGFDLPRPTGAEAAAAGLRGGRVELLTLADVARLPDHWFGYDAADLVILNTSNAEFIGKLFGESSSAGDRVKRAALLEWVRRGGRLVVGIGENAALVESMCRPQPDGSRTDLHGLLPIELRGSRQVEKLTLSWSAGATSKSASDISAELGTSRGRFTAARLAAKSASSGQILIPPRETVAKGNEPIAAQGAYGLGRVTVVGFDLDRAPFLSFPRRAEFWDWILREGGTNLTSLQSNKPREFGSTDDEDQFSLAMRMHGDAFEGVPVVSFGWVAVLIVLYILLIGPVEYFVLKRVLGRLELTWITFPIIVLTVSLAAYYSAYSIKGRDLKINKLDVVEVDPASGRVYGTTWCTIFSPRTDTYTIGVTPGENWGATEPGTEVSWSGSPRGGRASLMRRKYSYHSDSGAIADGLDQVPVQVWSTKSFRANWSSRVDPNAADALAKSDLYHPVGDRQAVVGSFTLNLPVPLLSDCVLLYGGQAMPLSGGTIRTGERVQLVWEKAIPATQWLQKESRLTEVLARVKGGAAPAQQAGPAAAAPPTLSSTSLPLLGILFHEASMQHGEGIVPQNSSLRRLDQTWRLAENHRNEVILVGRAVLPVGPGEETLAGPAAASRLWLKGLPGTGEREPMPRGSTGRQETWVRVYLPVR